MNEDVAMPLPKRSVPRIAALAALLLLPLAACTGAATPTSDPYATATPIYDVELARETLASARERWRDNGSADYSYHATYECHWCGYHDQPLEVTVRNDAVYSVVHVETGTWLNRDAYFPYNGPFATIDDLLDEIGNLLWPPSPAYWLGVGYHPALGYPTGIGSDVKYNIIDDEAGVILTNYKPISPDAPPAPTPTPAHEDLAELARARALWESKGSEDYTIEVARAGIEYESFSVTVRDGELSSITSVGEVDGRPHGARVTSREVCGFRCTPTIEGLFEQIERRIGFSRPSWVVHATYDSNYGYPTEVAWGNPGGRETPAGSPTPTSSDNGITLKVTGYQPLSEPTTSNHQSLTPAASSLGTAERHASVMDLFSDGGAVTTLSVGPSATVEDVLEKGLRLAGASPVHLAVRGTAAADLTPFDIMAIYALYQSRM